MVTDAAAAPARAETAIHYGLRLLLTVFLLALYVLGQRVPLPLIDGKAFAEFSGYSGALDKVSVLALGINPLITGFLLVELFSLITSPGRRLRKDRTAGRAKLNRAALITSLLLSAVQAMGISMFLGSVTTPGGAPLVLDPGWGFKLLTIATLTGVTAGLFVLGNLLSDYGIGNGFALLILTDIVWSFWEVGMALGSQGLGGSLYAGAGLLLAGILAGLLVRWFRSADAAQIPAFPQGILPVQFARAVLALPLVLGFSEGLTGRNSGVVQPVVTLIAVSLFSWLVFHLFSSRSRLEANVPEPDEVLDGLADTLERRLLPSTALLALGAAAFLAWSHFQPDTFVASLDLLNLILVLAIALDLRDQFVFLREPQTTARLVQLDNVHFACRLVARLREEEIEPLARGLHFRSLYFFFGALFKIDVFVPWRHLGRSREILAELEVAREIKAF
jgi:SecY